MLMSFGGNPDRLNIIIATTEHAPAIAEVLKLSFQEIRDLYTPQAYTATVMSTDQVNRRIEEGTVWLASLGEKPVGTISGVLSGADFYIQSMAVIPVARGQHVGLRLLKALQHYAKEKNCASLLLSTSPYLKKAIRIYEKFGFEIINEPPYELEGVPLFSMGKRIE